MKIDPENMNPPAWFDLPDDDDGARVLIRVCTGDDIEAINKQTTKRQAPEYRGGKRYEVPPKIDEPAQKELMWDFVIVDWEGINDMNGNVIPCTKENKVKLMGKSIQFAAFIGECLTTLVEDGATRQEESEKN